MSTTILVTGANRGIGLEFVRQYLAAGCEVIATCRSPGKATDLAGLANEANSQLQVLQLEVTDADSISALARTLGGRRIDVLINNAGTYGPTGAGLGSLDAQAWLDVFATNSIAPLQLTGALLDNLKAAPQAKIIGISSRMGSISDNTSGGAHIYRSSKAALNAALAAAAIDLRDQGITVGILHPGWVQTDMGGTNALIDAPTSVAGLRKVIEELNLSNSGGFFSYDGSTIPW